MICFLLKGLNPTLKKHWTLSCISNHGIVGKQQKENYPKSVYRVEEKMQSINSDFVFFCSLHPYPDIWGQ